MVHDGRPAADRSGATALRLTSRGTAVDRNDLWLLLAVVLGTIAFQWPIHDRWLALLDEGYILSIADDINRGRVLYRDVTVDAPFPGAFYLLAWWFRWTGPSVESSRLLAVGGFALFTGAMFRIVRELLPRLWALAFVVLLLCYRVWAFPHWHIYSYSLMAATLVTIAVALVCSPERRSAGRIVLAGLLLGAGILCKQNYGLALLGSLGLVLLIAPWLDPTRTPTWREALAPALLLAAPAIVAVIPAIVWLASQGALKPMIEQTLYFPFSVLGRMSFTELPRLWPLLGQDAELRAQIGSYFPSILATLWWGSCPGCFVSDMSRGWVYAATGLWDTTLKLAYWLPLLVYFLAALLWLPRVALARFRGSAPGDGERRLLLLALAGGFLLSFAKPRDWVHLMMVYPACLAIAAVLLHDAVAVLPRRLGGVVRAAAVAAAAALLLVSLALMLDLRRTIDWPLKAARAGVHVDPHNGPIVEDVLAYVKDNVPPGEPLPVYPVQPMLGFLAGRTTAGGYYVIWPFQDAGRDAAIIRDLERNHVSHVIYSLSQYAHLRSFQTNASELFDYLASHYEIDRVFSREPNGPLVVALRRRDTEPAGIALETRLVPADARGTGHPSGDTAAPDASSGDAPARDGATWTTWPFGRVLTQPLGTTEQPGIVRLPLVVPADASTLQLDFGVNPDRWLGLHGGPFVFTIKVAAGADGTGAEAVEMFRAQVDPAIVLGDRGWRRARVDLSRWAGKAVTIELAVATTRPEPSPDNLVGWREPAFVAPSS
jgi:hypothetical protein